MFNSKNFQREISSRSKEISGKEGVSTIIKYTPSCYNNTYIYIMAEFILRGENYVISFEKVKWESVPLKPFLHVHQVFIKRFCQLTQRYIGIISKQYGKAVSWYCCKISYINQKE